jgi:type IV pilus assembly protein PilB
VIRHADELSRYLSAYAQQLPLEGDDADRMSEVQWHSAHADSHDTVAFQRARRFALPLVDLATLAPESSAVECIPPDVARRFQTVPLALHDGVLGVAVSDPADADVVPTLSFFSSDRIALFIADSGRIRQCIAELYDRVEDAHVARQLGLDAKAASLADETEQDAKRLAGEQPIVRLIDDTIAEAVRRRASDIHLRPGADGIELLLRIDNELISVRRFIVALRPALISRVKVLAGMNVAEHRVPQDGRATYTSADGRRIDLRVSVLPTVHGESVAIRLLDTAQGLRNISQLGFSANDQTRFVDLMTRNHGMILVTGPTGSGKSTTLYAALLEARKEHLNTITVEDPVEYKIDDVQQMQVNRAAGFTFASALRNILRHDPDVIMVGEIRDAETAKIAVESALTGHLLFSTLHTNTAATTITRLLDLGVESFLLRATLLGVVSQRLMRRNCPHCLEREDVPAHWRKALDVREDEEFVRGVGCSRCDGTGVLGRVAAYELMPISPAIRTLIQRECEAEPIHDTAVREGMVPITHSAVELARKGVISFNEAFRLRVD